MKIDGYCVCAWSAELRLRRAYQSDGGKACGDAIYTAIRLCGEVFGLSGHGFSTDVDVMSQLPPRFPARIRRISSIRAANTFSRPSCVGW